MASSTMGSKSLKEYLKKYGSNDQEDEKKVKKKKKKVKPVASGVLVVDEDPVWQKPVKIEEEENDSADEDKPQVDEDIEVKRMKRLELIRARRTYNAIAEDGSGWVILSPKHPNSADPYSDMSPHYKRNVRNDTPSPEYEGKALNCGGDDANLSPPRQKQRQHHSPSPVPVTNLNSDLSPPHKRRYRNDTPSPEPQLKPSREASDLSPPQRQRKYHHSPSPKPDTKSKNSSGLNPDLSPPRRRRAAAESPKLKPLKEDTDLSPPRQKWRRHYTPPKLEPDLSPPRKRKKDVGRSGLPDNSHLSPRRSTQSGNSRASMAQDISPPRKNRKESSDLVSSKEPPKTGLITGRDMREEIKTKKEASLLLEMDPSISGRGAEPVYRDKKTGERISKDDYLKSKHKVEEKPKD